MEGGGRRRKGEVVCWGGGGGGVERGGISEMWTIQVLSPVTYNVNQSISFS